MAIWNRILIVFKTFFFPGFVMTVMPGHPYHEKIADIIIPIVKRNALAYCILSDDCSPIDRDGGYHALKIFRYNKGGYRMEYARADLLIVKDDTIVAQVEIEEKDRSPTKLFGKVLTSAHCRFYEYKSGTVPKEKGPFLFNDSFKFIQIVRFDESDYVGESEYPERWNQVREDVKEMLAKKVIGPSGPSDRRIEYYLLYGEDGVIESRLKTILSDL